MEILKEADLRRKWKEPTGGIYVFFGAEDYLKTHLIETARKAICPDEGLACFNDITIDFPDYSANALEDALSVPPMMTERKLVVLRSFRFDVLAKKPSEVESLIAVLEHYREDDSNLLIISVVAGGIDEGYLPKKPSEILKKLDKVATLVHFEEPSPSSLTVWVGRHLASRGISAPAPVVSFFVEYCGKNMVSLLSEIGKLAAYVKAAGRNEATRKDVLTVCMPQGDYDTYALSNALLAGNRGKMLDVLAVMKFRRVKPELIMAEISRISADLLLCKTLLEAGQNVSLINTALDMKSEFKTELYVKTARAWKREYIEALAARAASADLAMKSYGKRGYEEIEKFICLL